MNNSRRCMVKNVCTYTFLFGTLMGATYANAADISGTVTTMIEGLSTPVNGIDSEMSVSIYTGDACDNIEGEGGASVQSDGTYTVGGLDTDTQYLVRYESNGAPYLEEWFAGFDTDGNPTSSQDCNEAEKVKFEGETTSQTQVDLEVDQGALIKGTVTGPDALSYVADACITAYTDACEDWDTAHVSDARTGSNGGYTITVPPGAAYHIEVNPECSGDGSPIYVREFWSPMGGDSDCSSAKYTEMTSLSTPVEDIDFQLELGGEIEGTLKAGGVAIEGNTNSLAVIAYTGEPCGEKEYITEGHMEDDGTYSIYGLPFDTPYFLTTQDHNSSYVTEWFAGFDDEGAGNSSPDCNSADSITLDSTNNVISGADFNLETGGTIAGTLYEEEVAINGNENQMGVAIYTGSPCDDRERVGEQSIDENGSYTVGGLNLSETFYVRTYTDDAPYQERWFKGFDGSDNPTMSDDCNDAAGLSFEEQSTEIDGIDFNYEQSALIQGVVNGYDNTAFEGACVYAFSATSGEWDDILAGEARTGEDGTYILPVPESAGYYIYVEPRCSEAQAANLSAYWAGDEVTTNSDFAVKTNDASVDNPITGIDFTLNEGAIISGHVSTLDDEGATSPVANICVNVFTGSVCDNLNWEDNGHTDDNGDYSVVIPFGQDYYLQTQVSCGDNQLVDKYWNDTDDKGTYSCGEASAVTTIEGGDETIADFVLEPGVIISGTITSQGDGESVGNIKVFAQLNKCENSSSLSQSYSSTEDSDKGSYSLLVPEGVPVYLQTCVNCGNSDSASGYMDIWYPSVSEPNCANAESVEGPVAGVNLALPIDSDGDEISDYDEVNTYGTDPLLTDTDGDGLSDTAEVYLWGDAYGELDDEGNIINVGEPDDEGNYINDGDIDNDNIPNIAEVDADGDGVSDLREFARGTSMADAGDVPTDLTLYDDFSSASLDSEKWKTTNQYIREVESGALRLFEEGSGTFSNSVTTNSTSTRKIRTTVRLNEATAYTDGNAFFNVGGRFYNTTSDADALTRQVRASISIGDFGDDEDGLAVSYWIGTNNNENGDYEEFTSGYILSAGDNGLALDTAYQLEIKYDENNNFTFTIYDATETELGTVSVPGPAFGVLIDANRWLQVMTLGDGGRIDVTVDSVEMGDVDPALYATYDDFSETTLSSDKWATSEAVRSITDAGELRLLSHSFTDQRTVRSVLKERFSYIETKVKFSSQSALEDSKSDTELRARLSGTLYNSSHGPGSGLSYNGAEGDVWAQVAINYSAENGLTAYATVEEAADANWDSYNTTINDTLNIDIDYDTEYILYIGFTGDFIAVGIDSVDGTQHAMEGDTIDTPKYLPYAPSMELVARVSVDGGAGLSEVYFDDVQVAGDPLEKDGDLNVDSNVNLQDAILGLQNLTGGGDGQVWAAGDTNGDGAIGLPDVLDVLSEISN